MIKLSGNTKSQNFRAFLPLLIADLSIATVLNVLIRGGVELSPQFFAAEVILAIFVVISWPIWLLIWALLKGIFLFTMGPSPTMKKKEIVDRWLRFHNSKGKAVRENIEASPELVELEQLPREAVLPAVQLHAELSGALFDAKERSRDLPAPQWRPRWGRILITLAITLLIVLPIVSKNSDQETALQPGEREQIEKSAEPQWVQVKYRDTPVNVANGYFTHWKVSETGNVRDVWYDREDEYMLINLSGTVYHYCGFDILWWNNFSNYSPGTDYYYSNLIKGYPMFDCRNFNIPF
jgi:hypothetical protein